MFKIVESKPKGDVVELNDVMECQLEDKIIMAEKDRVQDILIYAGTNTYHACKLYHWSSVYIRPIVRTMYKTIKEAIQSRLEKGMQVYVFANRGEYRAAIKYNGERM